MSTVAVRRPLIDLESEVPCTGEPTSCLKADHSSHSIGSHDMIVVPIRRPRVALGSLA